MGDSVNPVPEGFHTVTPYVTVKGAAGGRSKPGRSSAGRTRTELSGTPRS
jgi:hypothetical protein